MVVIYVALLPNHQFVNLWKVGCLFQYCFNSLESNTASLVKLFLTLCYTCYLVYLVKAVCMQLQASVIVFTHCFVVIYILATLRVQYTILLLHAKQKKIDFKLKEVPRAVVMPKNVSRMSKAASLLLTVKGNTHTVAFFLQPQVSVHDFF